MDHLEELVGEPLEREALNERRYAHELSLIEAEELRPGIADYLAAAERHGAEARDRLELVAPLDRHAPRAARARGRLGRDPHGRRRPRRARSRTRRHVSRGARRCSASRADEAVVFEDSPNGVRAGKAAGIFVVGDPERGHARLRARRRPTSSSTRSPTCRRTSCSRASADEPHERSRDARRRRRRARAARAAATATTPAATPASRASSDERAPAREGLRDDERREDRRARPSRAARSTRGGSRRPDDADRADRLQHDGAGADREHRCPRRAHARLQPTSDRGGRGDDRHARRRERDEHGGDRCAAHRGRRRAAGRSSCAASSATKSAANAPSRPNADGSPIAWPAQRADGGAADPARPRAARRRRAARAGRSAACRRPRAPTTRRRRAATRAKRFSTWPRNDCATRDPDRRVARVQQQRGDDRGGDAAARAEDGDGRDLRRAGERRRRHDDRRERVEVRGAREHAERRAERERGGKSGAAMRAPLRMPLPGSARAFSRLPQTCIDAPLPRLVARVVDERPAARVRAAGLQALPRAVGHRLADRREQAAEPAGHARSRRARNRSRRPRSAPRGRRGAQPRRAWPTRAVAIDLDAVVRAQQLAQRLAHGARVRGIRARLRGWAPFCETMDGEPATRPARVAELVAPLLEIGGVDEVADQLQISP